MLMPPNQPNQNQYDFIMNHPTKPKRQLNLGNSMRSRIIIVAIAVILVIIAIATINSFLKKESTAQAQRLTLIAQTETEIIRVSGLAKDKAKDIKTQNYALTTRISMESSQLQTKKILAGRGVSAKSVNKKLGATKNPKTDAALDEAAKNNRFDDTFYVIMDKQLADYQLLLKTAHSNGTPVEKKTLDSAYQNAGRLKAKQLSSTVQ